MKNLKTIVAIIATTLLLAMLIGCSDEPEYSAHSVPLMFDVDENTNLKDVILNEIHASKTVDRNHEDYGMYSEHKISDIEEFFVPTIEFEGFELFSMFFDEAGFVYEYAPIERAENYAHHYETGYQIRIGRPGYQKKSTPEVLEGLAQEDDTYSEEKGFVQSGYSIYTQIGDSILRVDVPYELADYEYLRDLANQVIKSAEKVDVEYKLDVMRNSTD